MRYLGQGHEITVPLPAEALHGEDDAILKSAFEAEYQRLYGRLIENLDIEVLTWSLTVSTDPPKIAPLPKTAERAAPKPAGMRHVRDPVAGSVPTALYDRAALAPGHYLEGPALVVEEETTTVVPVGFDLRVDGLGYLELSRKDGNQ